MHIFYRHIPLLMALVITSLALGVQASRSANASDISVDIRTLTDPSRAVTFEQVFALNTAQFSSSPRRDVNFGYTRNVVWLRVALTSASDRRAILSLTPNFVDLIDIYVDRGEQRAQLASEFTHVKTGDHRPVPAAGMSALDDAVELDLKAHETRLIYIRLASVSNVLTTEVQVYPRVERAWRNTVAMLIVGSWFGGMGILCIVQAVFFYYDRKPGNLLLAISTLMVAVVYTGTLGASRMLLFPLGGVGNDVFLSVSIWLCFIASAFTAIHILELKENSPWLHRVFLAFAAMGLIGIVCGVLGLHLIFAPFGNVASIVLATLAAAQALRTANRSGAATRLRAVAYSVLWAGVVAVMVQRTVLIDLPIWTVHFYGVACLLQALLLTGALSVRLRAAENLNLAMQKQALVAAQEAEVQARMLVEERTRELVAARQTAEDALQAELASQQQQVRFMEVISHQYRTPLAAIRTNVDNVGLSLPPSDEANHTRLERMRKGILRLVEVLEVNLSRARLQGASFRPVLAHASAADVVEAAAVRGRDLLQSRIVTNISDDAAVVRIQADPDMLSVAIVNLLENAVKYSRSRGREPVVLSCRVEDGKVAIAITDKGIGIPPDEIELAFTPAWRGSNATALDGSGMGLSLVGRIVAVHDGTIDIDSTVGVGTTVTIWLPAILG